MANHKQELPMLGIMIGTKYRNFVQDLPYIIPTKQQFIVHPSFRGEDFFFISANQKKEFPMAGLDINVCPVPVKTNVGQVDLVLRLSDWTSEKIRDSQTCRYDGQIYSHWYEILGLLYKRALFDLQFAHNLF